VTEIDEVVAWRPAERTQFLIDHYGPASHVAVALGVSPSQPSRWRRGLETPSPEKGRLVIDLEHVLARAMLLWSPTDAAQWMDSANAFLDGATPLDVLTVRGASDVLDALDATLAGAYA
jgi:uncharacterized protein (DUF2384 family)